MPRLLVHDKAREDVEAIARHIAHDNLAAALRFYDATELDFDFLSTWPGAGPQIEPPIESAPDLRFWPITRFRSFLIIYRSLPDGVEIARVIHGARDMFRVLRSE